MHTSLEQPSEPTLENGRRPNLRLDLGLLVLRGAGLFLALTFGRQKVWMLAGQILSARPIADRDITHFLASFGIAALGMTVTLYVSMKLGIDRDPACPAIACAQNVRHET